jgi:rhodanese-related sulfurtransferase
MTRRTLLALALAAIAGASLAADPPARPTVPQVCQNCHKPAAGEIRGMYENVAFRTQSLQLKIDEVTEVVRFDEKTLRIVDAEAEKPGSALRDIAKNREARIEYTEKDGVKTASLISFKGPIKIAPDKLVVFADVDRLVAQGPEKGGYTLIDSRPAPRFMEGAIPSAINLPYPAWDKFVGRLPEDKARLVIFYCSGITCMMSPNSMKRAAALGYTNAKVYREGMPEWTARRFGVISAAFFKDAYVDKGIPHVLLDVRDPGAASAGFIAGAVAIPAAQVKAAIAQLPDKKLRAPILVYDARGGEAAAAAARAISEAGFANVMLVTGGFEAWKAASYPVATGSAGTKIAYAPKPRPGEVSIEEFTRLANATPSDTLILDVRNAEEAKDGMIKGAMLIPDEDLAARIAEVPKDKRIVTHCMTGVRAEMAYHKLKDKGYNAGFLKAAVDIKGTGAFTLTPN